MPLKKLTQSATEIILKGRKRSTLPENAVQLQEFLEILEDYSEFGLTDLIYDVVGGSGGQEEKLSLQLLLETAFDEARRMKSSYVGTEHLFLGLVRLARPEKLETARKKVAELSGIPSLEAQRKAATTTPLLDSFCEDLVEKAKKDKLDPFYGRKQVLERMVQILLRREKNSPLVIGESGVGKTALVYGLSTRIASGNVPVRLQKKRILRLKFPQLLGAFGPRKSLEAGFSGLLEEAAESENVILFIDEMHQLMGKSFLVEATSPLVEIIKDAVEAGEFQFIGVTTSQEYSRYLEFDQGLVRRVEPLLMKEPSPEDVVNILKAVSSNFENYHRIRFEDDVYEEVFRLADRYMPQGAFPDKAVEILDSVGAEIRTKTLPNNNIKTASKVISNLEKEMDEKMSAAQWSEAVNLKKERDALLETIEAPNSEKEKILKADTSLVAKVVSQKTGIPLAEIEEGEKERLVNMEESLSHYVVGQDHAVRALCKTLRRSRVGLTNANRPTGSFLFLGPTGVGKTELARKLVDVLFEEGDLIRFDMSEFRERHTASRLIGAPPGYVGYGQGGELTERVRRNPYSVVLFDEMEKAHPEVLNLLLQIMEEGELRDGKGQVTDFTNTVIILTSNVGADLVSKGYLGFDLSESPQSEYEHVKNNLLDNLKSQVRPEFLNRLNDVLVFRSLTPNDIKKIVELRLGELEERLEDLGLTLEVTSAAKDLLAHMGYSKEYGARPLERVIEEKIEAPLSERVLDDEVEEGGLVKVRVRKGAIKICLQ